MTLRQADPDPIRAKALNLSFGSFVSSAVSKQVTKAAIELADEAHPLAVGNVLLDVML